VTQLKSKLKYRPPFKDRVSELSEASEEPSPHKRAKVEESSTSKTSIGDSKTWEPASP